jgi:hypothetical protein
MMKPKKRHHVHKMRPAEPASVLVKPTPGAVRLAATSSWQDRKRRCDEYRAREAAAAEAKKKARGA